LRKNKIIRQFTAIALLLLFVLGNMPKQWMHDLFANHVDYKNGIVEQPHNTNVYQSSFHCQTDHFIVESPFTNDLPPMLTDRLVGYLQYKNLPYNFSTVDHHRQIALRGPPVFS
jgi:hypothetical protein